jgi:hypothetical protein
MTDTALDDALSITAHVAPDEPRAWAGTSWLIGAASLGLSLRPASLGRQAARPTPALLVLPAWLVVWWVLGACATQAASPPPFRPAAVWSVEAAFREAIQLWADGQLEALWEHGLWSSRYRVSRETFVRSMRHRVVKPTCCWDRIHTVRVHLHATDEALVEALVGVDVKTLGTAVVRSMLVSLRREEGVWRVTLEDFLNKPEDALSSLRAPW